MSTNRGEELASTGPAAEGRVPHTANAAFVRMGCRSLLASAHLHTLHTHGGLTLNFSTVRCTSKQHLRNESEQTHSDLCYRT